ncbi:hypothetical protein Tco_1261348 [Tanacetum coccineum]
MDLNFVADGNLRELSAEEVWEAIESFAQGQKEWDNPPNIISEQELASLRAQAEKMFGNEKTWFEIPRCIEWDKVDNQSPQSTSQVLPSFEEYTPPMTYSEEVEETIGILMEIPSVDKPEPQLLPNFSPLDVSLGDKRGTNPPINPYSLGSFRMKVVDPLTIHTPPSSRMA